MFVGHGLAAFALVAAVAHWRGFAPERALRFGVLAGLFATVPDLDILYGPVGLVGGISGVADAAAAFWETGNAVHRGPTHSLLVAVAAATAFGAIRHRSSALRALGAGVLAAVAAFVFATSGLLYALVTAFFLVGGLAVVWLGVRWEVPPVAVGCLALVGLGSHPFGDLLTGTPPAILYPLDVVVISDRLALHPDATIHLLGAFLVELAVIWLAFAVACRLRDRPTSATVDRRAALGVAYGGAALVLPAPTLETSYQFVFSVLALGAMGVPLRRIRRRDAYRSVGTALAAVTAAALAYGVAYVLL